MNVEERQPLAPWAKSLILTGIILVVGVPLIVWLRRSADAAWASMQDRTRAMYEEAKARPGARPVLYGAAEPGNAWEDYAVAAKELEPIRDQIAKVTSYIQRHPAAKRDEARALVDSKPKALELLAKGAHRAEGNFPYDWSSGLARRQVPSSSSYLVTFAIAQARFLSEAGEARDAMFLLLDALQFSSDLRRNATMLGEMHGGSAGSAVLDEVKDLLLARKLSAQDLAALAKALESVDTHWPDYTISLRNESMMVRAALESDDPEKIIGKDLSALKAWRYGFSVRRMAAEAAAQIEKHIDQSIRNEALPWKQRVAAQAELQRKIQFSSNVFVMLAHRGVSVQGTERLARAKLRILRAALYYRATGLCASLVDPYGDTLKYAVAGDKVRMWSVGSDGEDQNGKGDWPQYKIAQDIVLELGK